MKILVCIASYGSRNDPYLRQLLDEYAAMPYGVDVVVLSNIDKPLRAGVELKVGLPNRNPWSLPFAHRSLFAERRDRYDLFIYSEDDTLITARHIEAFLSATKVLQAGEIAGFLRSEEGPDGTVYYSTIHRHYRWDPRSVRRRGEDVFAFFTNEHGACYMLTRDQLLRAIASDGFLVSPHEGKYDMLVSAATDPYTQCGFKKLVCISHLEDFTCKHLTNKYVGRTGLAKPMVDLQIDRLLAVGLDAHAVPEPMRVQTHLAGTRWAKSCYEPRRDDLLELVPSDARTVLSVGCGWGMTERALVERGCDVTAVPLDVAIGAVAASQNGIRVLEATPEDAARILPQGEFDVVIMSGILHLIDDPAGLLQQYRRVLSSAGVIMFSCPNLAHLAVSARRLMGDPEMRGLADVRASGVQRTSISRVCAWVSLAGLAVVHVQTRCAERWARYDRLTLGLARSWWAEEIAVMARPAHRPLN
jgi:2-polyprenyl-3-methyl-5-hydroxy-6-metoxy-1,4-benzoquinol methylase